MAVIPLRRIGGTTEDSRDLRIGKTNTEGRRTDGTFPYVRLHEATGAVYSKAVAFLAEVKTLYESEQSKPPPPVSFRRRSLCRCSLKSIEDFRAKPIYEGDHTRVDLAYAVYALAHGVPENTARRACFA